MSAQRKVHSKFNMPLGVFYLAGVPPSVPKSYLGGYKPAGLRPLGLAVLCRRWLAAACDEPAIPTAVTRTAVWGGTPFSNSCDSPEGRKSGGPGRPDGRPGFPPLRLSSLRTRELSHLGEVDLSLCVRCACLSQFKTLHSRIKSLRIMNTRFH